MDYPEFDPFRGGGGRQPQTQRVIPLGARLRAERIEKARRARERRVRFKMLLMLVALSFLLYATQSEWGRQHFSAPSMSVYIDGLSKALAGAQGNLIYFVLTIVVLFVRLPGSLMLIVGALAYGPIHGLLLGWSATILGTSATFLYGRRFSSKKCQSRLDEALPACRARLLTWRRTQETSSTRSRFERVWVDLCAASLPDERDISCPATYPRSGSGARWASWTAAWRSAPAR
ncbi:MAG: hypothetical protein H6683_06560 [Deltaproteobacteria bacterium]|nr:hypothetical protein [Deltaproteobacteria bacterium]